MCNTIVLLAFSLFTTLTVSSLSYAKGNERGNVSAQFSVTDPQQKMSKDLLREILQYLRARDLGNLGALNRSWRSTINRLELWRSILPSGSIKNEKDLVVNLLTQGNFALGESMLTGRDDVQKIVQAALEIAVYHLNTDRVEKLAQKGGDLTRVRILDKGTEYTVMHTPLSWATYKKNIKLLKKLVEMKMDVNQPVITFHNQDQRLEFRRTVLHLASRWTFETVDTLLKAGAEVNAITTFSSKESPLHFAAGSKHPERAQVLQRLLEAGASIEVKGDLDCTPLHNAAMVGNAEGVRILLEAGADRYAKYWAGIGYNAIELAAIYGNSETLKLLVDGLPWTNINWLNSNRFSVLHYAAASEKESLEKVRVLVEAGADVCFASRNGKYPHVSAEKSGNSEAAVFLKSLYESKLCSDSVSESAPESESGVSYWSRCLIQ